MALQKNNVASEKALAGGSEAFRRQDLPTARRLYDKALLWAPQASLHLAKALGNRSAVAKEEGRWRDCAVDCERALRLLNTYTVGDDAWRQQFRARVEARLATAKRELPAEPKAAECLPAVFGRASVETAELCVSDAVRFVWTKDKGRGLVAERGIPAGSVVLTERPLAVAPCVPLPAQPDKCLACIRALNATWLPCCVCADTRIRFCGEECRDVASVAGAREANCIHLTLGDHQAYQRLLLVSRCLAATPPHLLTSWGHPPCRAMAQRRLVGISGDDSEPKTGVGEEGGLAVSDRDQLFRLATTLPAH